MPRSLFIFTVLCLLALCAHADELAVRVDKTSLYARVGNQPEQLIDASVNEGSAYAAGRFEDGTALLVYRGHSADQVRDIQVVRYQDGQWSSPHSLNVDEWRSASAVADGPALAINGGRAAVAWFTAADNDPRVLLSLSPDAGTRFTMPVRVSEKPALGRVATLLLRDGSMLVAWIDQTGSILFRRVALNLTLDPITTLVPSSQVEITGDLHLRLLKDYDRTPARISIAFSSTDGKEAQSRDYDLPSLSSLAGRRPCAPCDEADAMATRGFAVRGRIIELSADHHTLKLQHAGIPGVMRAQTLTCQIDPAPLPPGISAQSEILARIERRGRAWWIFDVHALKAAR